MLAHLLPQDVDVLDPNAATSFPSWRIAAGPCYLHLRLALFPCFCQNKVVQEDLWWHISDFQILLWFLPIKCGMYFWYKVIFLIRCDMGSWMSVWCRINFSSRQFEFPNHILCLLGLAFRWWRRSSQDPVSNLKLRINCVQHTSLLEPWVLFSWGLASIRLLCSQAASSIHYIHQIMWNSSSLHLIVGKQPILQ